MLGINGITVRFGETVAVDHADLEVRDGERVAVLGPSGSGKSTLLRGVAGLEALATGSVTWDGEDLAGVPPYQRRFGFMFQGYALFPHMTVGDNVGFGLRMDGMAKREIDKRVGEVLGWVGMDGFAARTMEGLSGGEQQRVALARTLAPRPRLIMLDEPLGALDRALRERLIGEMTELLERAGTTALYVTHDHDEAAIIADRVAIMRAGAIVQTAPMSEIRRSPADDWVAAFVR
ncbi:MAG TPA: ABC transporter ATP-binding protein [Acidimicrobiia bacterium]|nr:ABC transporter ATP-binding protein [Acidimicrobiia bacterium]